MRVPALGEAATQLPWLCPSAAALLALARAPAAGTWAEIRRDPAAVLLVVRQTACSGACQPRLASCFSAALRDPAVVEGALRFLEQRRTAPADDPLSWVRQPTACWVDWGRPQLRPIHQAALSYARLAERLAEVTGRADPDLAWVAGLLTPLGWFAVCAVDASQAAACLADPELAQGPAAVQQRYWGHDQGAIARRLLRRWRLPRGLAVVVGHLGLPVDIAQALGADPELFRIVQTAVALVEQQGRGLRLAGGTEAAENAAALRLGAAEHEALRRELAEPAAALDPAWGPPQEVPLLADLLALAAENRRLQDAPLLEQLERDQDLLQQALERLRAGEAERLQERKLTALADFAAGAAHEINNPLAVISGQAQYLLGHESEPPRQRALQTIIGQAQRIHQVLNELMLFARPPRPQKQRVDIRSLIREAVLSLGDLAAQRQVQLLCPEPPHAVYLPADARQVATALTCLLRNAIEAAPGGGWARLQLETPSRDCLELVIEDSGSGPVPAQREHLFDPFYSGRQAGRGRGLGLPTAWRLAREHGGGVRYETRPGGPTRFILSLPREVDGNGQAADGRELAARTEPANGHPPSLVRES